MSRSKEDLLRKGGLFIPLIFSFGAACEDIPLDVFLDDPTKISNSIRTINNFFQADGIVCCGNEDMLSEVFRCAASMSEGALCDPGDKEFAALMETEINELAGKGRPAVTLEAARRLRVLMPDSVLLAVIAGPVRIAGRLTGKRPVETLDHPDFLGLTTKAVLTFMRSMGEAGADIFLVREDFSEPMGPKYSAVLNRCYSPLWNTAKFYGMHALLMPERCPPENVPLFKKIVDKIVFPPGSARESVGMFKKPSFSIPWSLLEKTPGEIEASLSEGFIMETVHSRKAFLITTDQEVPESVDKERMIEGIKTIKDLFEVGA